MIFLREETLTKVFLVVGPLRGEEGKKPLFFHQRDFFYVRLPLVVQGVNPPPPLIVLTIKIKFVLCLGDALILKTPGTSEFL